MLNFFRHHQKAIMLIAAVVVVSFTFWGATTKTGSNGANADDAIVTIYNRDYTRAEIDRLDRFQTLAMRLGLFEFAEGVQMIAHRYTFKTGYPLDFALNLLVLRREMERNGVQVSDADAREAFKHLPAFQTRDGQYDAARASAFEGSLGSEDNGLGSYGFSVADVYDMLRDSIGFQKLEELVGGNVVVNQGLVDKFYQEQRQAIKASSIPFALDDFKKSVSISDADIKKYFDQNKDKYQTEPMRSVAYVYFEKPKAGEKDTPEQKLARQNEYSQKVNNFSTDVINDPSKFDALAKQLKQEVHTVPLFAQASPPAALKDESALVTEIFANDPKSHPVSDPVEGKDGYYIFKVTQNEPPKPEELKDVQGKIKDTLMAQKAQENMMKSASDIRKKLEDAIKAGKKFEDAAKEAGVHPQPIVEFTPSDPPKDLANGAQIAEEARYTPAGAFTKPLNTEHGVIIVYVQSKVLYKSPETAARKDALAHSLEEYTRRSLFHAWFDHRRDEANSVPHVSNL